MSEDRPEHLTEREYRLLVYIEERARAQDLMLKTTCDAASLNAAMHGGAAAALRRIARAMRNGSIPGWD